MVFSQLRFQFCLKDFLFVLVFNHFAFTEIFKELKLQRAYGALVLSVPMEVLSSVLQLTVLVVN